jgi:hypothetical protein
MSAARLDWGVQSKYFWDFLSCCGNYDTASGALRCYYISISFTPSVWSYEEQDYVLSERD